MFFQIKDGMHPTESRRIHGQMSEAILTAGLLSVSGGLQDAYTYVFRGKVFSNAQTGNIVLLSINIYNHNWSQALRYFIPLIFFAFGIIVAEWIREKYFNLQKIHWRQIVLINEILLLFIVGLLPERIDILANAMVSFSCAMQVQTFRKVTGYAFSSTMCIGNMRGGMESIFIYLKTKDRKVLKKAIRYWQIIFLFGIGAIIGGHLVSKFGACTIWGSCMFLFVCVGLMFIREERNIHMYSTTDMEDLKTT